MRALKFGLVGVANTALDVALFAGLTVGVGLRAAPANLISYSAGILLSFALNRSWTFRDRHRTGSGRQFGLFVVGSLVGLGLSTAVVGLLAGPCGPLGAKALSIGVTFAWNYLYSNWVVFKRKQTAQA